MAPLIYRPFGASREILFLTDVWILLRDLHLLLFFTLNKTKRHFLLLLFSTDVTSFLLLFEIRIYMQRNLLRDDDYRSKQ